MFAAIAVVAIALVGALVVLQAASGSSDKLPERVATGEGRILGDPNAPVTVVEYADFQCPVCKRAETSVLSQIEKDYVQSGKVKIEFRNYAFIGQESFNAAQAADAAGDQGKFWEYHDALFNAQGNENDGNYTYDKLVKLAQQVGLDVPKFEETLSGNVHLAAIQAESDARDGGIARTDVLRRRQEDRRGAAVRRVQVGDSGGAGEGARAPRRCACCCRWRWCSPPPASASPGT
jgi:protein-disulfide isomerase